MSNTRAERPLLAARELLDEALEDLAICHEYPERLWLAAGKALVATGLCDYARAQAASENDGVMRSLAGRVEGMADRAASFEAAVSHDGGKTWVDVERRAQPRADTTGAPDASDIPPSNTPESPADLDGAPSP